MAAREGSPTTTASDRAWEETIRLQRRQEVTAEENRIAGETGEVKCLAENGRVNPRYKHLLLSWQLERLNSAVDSG